MSLNAPTVLLINQVLSDLITKSDMFTCFDITRILRARGCKVNHKELRKIVHGLAGADLPPFRGSGYVRNSKVLIKNYSCNAEVYAHHKDDALNYCPDKLNPSTQSKVAPVNPPVYATVMTVSGPSNVALKTPPKVVKTKSVTKSVVKHKVLDAKRRLTTRDSRGRVTIHNGFVSLLGLKHNSLAYVSKRAQGYPGLVVLPKASKTGHLTTYRVDKSGNVRISKKVLEESGLSKANNFKMRLADNKSSIILLEH